MRKINNVLDVRKKGLTAIVAKAIVSKAIGSNRRGERRAAPSFAEKAAAWMTAVIAACPNSLLIFSYGQKVCE
jgi:hypothetical protein